MYAHLHSCCLPHFAGLLVKRAVRDVDHQRKHATYECAVEMLLNAMGRLLPNGRSSRTWRLCVVTCCCRLALCVQVYLKMDRPDKADQQVKVGAGACGLVAVPLIA